CRQNLLLDLLDLGVSEVELMLPVLLASFERGLSRADAGLRMHDTGGTPDGTRHGAHRPSELLAAETDVDIRATAASSDTDREVGRHRQDVAQVFDGDRRPLSAYRPLHQVQRSSLPAVQSLAKNKRIVIDAHLHQRLLLLQRLEIVVDLLDLLLL